jgi:long-chain acyl-CoA synthetase
MSDFEPRFSTLNDILDHARREHADRPFLGTKAGDAWTWMTHGEFGAAVDDARSGLALLGVDKGDVVAIISDNRREWAIMAYAAYGRGAVVVPMYEAQKDEAWRYILRDCGASVVAVATEKVRGRIDALRGDLPDLRHIVVFDDDAATAEGSVLFSDLGVAGAGTPSDPAEVTPDDVAGFVYTSGTTGNPKGVILDHRNFASNVSAVTDVFEVFPDDRTLSFLPWAHAFGQTVELHVLLSCGASTAFAQGTSTIIPFLSEIRPTMLVSVPRIFNQVYDGVNKRMASGSRLQKRLFDASLANEAKRRALAAEGRTSAVVEAQHKLFDRLVFSKVREGLGGNLRYAISGGAALATEVANFIDSLGIDVYEGYGLSETSPIVSANWPGSRKIGSVGKPIPGVRVEIDRTGREGDDGEIVVYGHCVMQGYHGLPDMTAEVLTDDGGFRTGDLGRLDEDGFLFITGRVKEQYKLENGKYVVPSPLEDKLALSPYVTSAMVYGDNRPYNVALLALDEAAVATWADGIGRSIEDATSDEEVHGLLKKEVSRTLAGSKGYERVLSFAIISEQFTVDNGTLTPTLKLKRDVVIAKYRDVLDSLYR